MKYLCFLITYLSICSVAPSLDVNTHDHRGIVCGDEADIEDFPNIGALLVRGQQHCGAALIRYDTVVTAAHCVYDPNITELSLRLGSSQWESGGKEILVKQIIIHEKFLPFQPDYDIAVVKLNENVNVTNTVPIHLAPPGRQYLVGTLGVVFGWGMTSSNAGSGNKTLRKVKVPVIKKTKCRNTNRGICITNNRMICAGYNKGLKNACLQASGSPYVINGELVGIFSFGAGFDLPTYPEVYACVPALNDWIKDHA